MFGKREQYIWDNYAYRFVINRVYRVIIKDAREGNSPVVFEVYERKSSCGGGVDFDVEIL